jgi:hypothetical protein
MNKKGLRAYAAKVRNLSDMMLEVEQLRDAVHETQEAGRQRLARTLTRSRSCSLKENSLQR